MVRGAARRATFYSGQLENGLRKFDTRFARLSRSKKPKMVRDRIYNVVSGVIHGGFDKTRKPRKTRKKEKNERKNKKQKTKRKGEGRNSRMKGESLLFVLPYFDAILYILKKFVRVMRYNFPRKRSVMIFRQ